MTVILSNLQLFPFTFGSSTNESSDSEVVFEIGIQLLSPLITLSINLSYNRFTD